MSRRAGSLVRHKNTQPKCRRFSYWTREAGQKASAARTVDGEPAEPTLCLSHSLPAWHLPELKK